MSLTSCEDILGEWSKPVPVTVAGTPGTISFDLAALEKASHDQSFTNLLTITGDGVVTYSSSNEAVATVDASTGKVTIVGPGTAIIKATVSNTANYSYATNEVSYTLTVNDGYSYLDLTTGEPVTKYVSSANSQVVTSSTTTWDGSKTLIVENDVTITGTVDLSGNTSLVLCDGAKLKVNGKIVYSADQKLTIYAQSTGSEVGQMTVDLTEATHTGSNDYAINCRDLNIHGGKLEFINHYTGDFGSDALYPLYDLNIYGGDIKAQAYSKTGDGVECSNLKISGGKLEAIGGNNNGASGGGSGIYASNMYVSGNAVVIATGADGGGSENGGYGIYCSVEVSGNATLTVTGGSATSGAGGKAIASKLTIMDNATVNATAGNSTGYYGGHGVDSHLYYYGGKFTIMGGTGSDDSHKGSGVIGTIYNMTAEPVSFERKTTTGWENFSVSGNGSESLGSSYVAARKQ
ncbi:MAG: Ig-like domain-containing protein [Aeriscardovia sp.]|nr:Ig-like domain-containing protein [Aeriscardovia sp.]